MSFVVVLPPKGADDADPRLLLARNLPAILAARVAVLDGDLPRCRARPPVSPLAPAG